MGDENKGKGGDGNQDGNKGGNPPPNPERPAWLPDKFKTPEDFRKSYDEAENKIRELSEKVKSAPAPDDGLSLSGGNVDDSDIPEIVTKAGLKQEDLEKQYAEHGELTPEQYAAFRKVNPGLGRKVVDAIARGMVAEGAIKTQTLQTIKAEAVKMVGGEQQWDVLRATAKTFVPADEIEDLETRLRSPKHYKGAIRDLLAHHSAAVEAGKTQPLIGGSAPSGSSVTREEFGRLMARASRGDRAALNQIRAIPQATIDSWKEDM